MGSPNESSLPRKATTEEIRTLVHQVDNIPFTAWLLTFTGAASQLARYGITVAWQNYLQNPRDGVMPGALGLGQAKATTIQNAYLFFQYLTPSIFAVVSDAWIGRYTTMMLSLALLVVGYLILMLTALPVAIQYGAGVGGLAAAMALIGLGQGGISAIQYPFIGDQIPEREPQVKRGRKGELVVTDRKLTVQNVFNGYYWMVNVASLSAVPTTLMEKHTDFWAAYLLPICILIASIAPVIIYNKRLVKLPPQGNVLPHASQVMWIAIRSRFHLSAAEPEYRAAHHKHDVPWTLAFVREIQRGLKCCRVILCFVIFWLCYNQTSNNVISQAGQMKQQGISNDTIQSLNSIACIIMGPIIQNLVFPFLRRRRVPLGPIVRMTVGFFFIAAGLAYITGLQQLIYSRGPCFEYPLECPDNAQISSSGSMAPNDVSIWLQTPLHFLLAVGEILALVSVSEYTYSEAPAGIKAMVQAFQNFAAAIGSALGMALGPVSKNPWLVIVFGTLAVTMGLCTALFWLVFRRYDVEYENRDMASSAVLSEAGNLEERECETTDNIRSDKNAGSR